MRSVVLATCQGERFLLAQLEGILSQLSAEDEVIISDDDSTDGTLAVLRGISEPRVQVITNTRRVGYAANFERAIARARGEVVLFSDQDDIWLPNKVAELDSALRRADCVASDAIVVDEELRVLHDSFFRLREAHRFDDLSIFRKPKIVGATLACRRSYLQTLLPFPRGVPHDFWITVNAAFDRKLEVLPTPLILYRRHDRAASVTATGQKRRMGIIAVERTRIAIHMLLRRLITRRRDSRRATERA